MQPEAIRSKELVPQQVGRRALPTHLNQQRRGLPKQEVSLWHTFLIVNQRLLLGFLEHTQVRNVIVEKKGKMMIFSQEEWHKHSRFTGDAGHERSMALNLDRASGIAVAAPQRHKRSRADHGSSRT